MSCSISSSAELEEMRQEALEVNTQKTHMDTMTREKVFPLKRGGCYVNTAAGPIQFGIPPETVKDHMINALQVPTHYILPSKRFDKKYGLNVAEFEFPAYFNFFLKKKQVNLICTKEAEDAIRIVFQETLIGPKEFPVNFSKSHHLKELEDEFYHTYDKSAIPNFPKERSYFAKNPLNPSELVTIDHLIRFSIFDESGIVYLENDVAVRKDKEHFVVLENGVEIAHIKDEVILGVNPEFEESNNKSTTILKNVFKDKKFKPFEPPLFGITVLGASHGFDPRGSTSGYIIWINGRGIMLDPPPFANAMLKQHAIPSSIIESIIISHCHADHDAGAFQKILESQKVEVIQKLSK